MRHAIAEILDILDDGQWHNLREIQIEMNLNQNQMEKIVEFLEEYEFVTADDEKGRIKLGENARRFLTQNVTS